MPNFQYKYVMIIYIITITILSHTPSNNIPKSGSGIPYLDNFFHFGEFFLLGLLFQLSYIEYKESKVNDFDIFLIIIFTFSFACIDELHQSFVSGRHCSISDLGFDFVGILASISYKKFF